MTSVSRLIWQLTANQRLLLHHVILVLRAIAAHEPVTRMTSANLAVCLAPALLWRGGRRAASPRQDDAERTLRDVGRLSVVVQRIVDAAATAGCEDSATATTLFGNRPGYPAPFAHLNGTSLERPPSTDDYEPLTGTLYIRGRIFESS